LRRRFMVEAGVCLPRQEGGILGVDVGAATRRHESPKFRAGGRIGRAVAQRALELGGRVSPRSAEDNAHNPKRDIS
jgi:hypothetical protein